MKFKWSDFDLKILGKMRTATGNKKLRRKDIMEWSMDGRMIMEGLKPGEKAIELLHPHVWVAYKEK